MNELNALKLAITVGFAALAWVAVAEHPTARNLRKAIIDTLPLM